MMRESKCTESQHHSEDNCTAATNDYRKDHCQDRAASVGLVGAGETDTIEDDFPDSCDKSATNRNDKERVSRAADEADDAEGRFERLLRAANNHQAEMKDPGGNKRPDGDEQWNKNNKEQRTDPAAHHLHHRVSVTAEHMSRAQQKVVKKIDHAAHASTDDGVNERFSEAAFAPAKICSEEFSAAQSVAHFIF